MLGRLHVALVVPHRPVSDVGLGQGVAAVLGAGQPGHEGTHLSQVSIPAPAGQRLAAQPGLIGGHHGVGVERLALASCRLLGPCSRGLPLLVEVLAGLYDPASGHVSGSPGREWFL